MSAASPSRHRSSAEVCLASQSSTSAGTHGPADAPPPLADDDDAKLPNMPPLPTLPPPALAPPPHQKSEGGGFEGRWEEEEVRDGVPPGVGATGKCGVGVEPGAGSVATVPGASQGGGAVIAAGGGGGTTSSSDASSQGGGGGGAALRVVRARPNNPSRT